MAKAATSPPLNVGIRNSDRSNNGCSARLSTATNTPKSTAARARQMTTPVSLQAISPAADQVIDQADQPGGEGCEPRPIRPGRMRRLGLIDPPPGSNDLSQKEIDQLLSPAPARTSIERSTLTLQGSDWPLVQALAEDGRAPYRQLAVRTHCHESTIRRRVEELIASGVLSFDVDLDTDAFGIRGPGPLVDVGGPRQAHPDRAGPSGSSRGPLLPPRPGQPTWSQRCSARTTARFTNSSPRRPQPSTVSRISKLPRSCEWSKCTPP